MLRPPAVAGRFYPGDPAALAREVDGYCTNQSAEKFAALACVVPHAGYNFSGGVAGAVYGRLQLPRRFILLGPRHYSIGAPLAILTEGAWQMPLGPAQIDEPLARTLRDACPALREDAAAHAREHSLEVQLPFLQRCVPDLIFVPVVLGTDRFAAMEELGRAVAQVVAAQQDPVLLICSSDFNHYEDDAVTRAKDGKAIRQILALDPRGLYDTVRQEGISMCGYAAAVAMLTAARQLGATRAELIRYATSGDVNGERESVVGYAGIVIR
jgi:AmmeMemoRadiSam system protein B